MRRIALDSKARPRYLAFSAATAWVAPRSGSYPLRRSDWLKSCIDMKPSDDLMRKAAADIEHENLGRDELLALLRDVTEQRDKVLSQYEAMAFQVDESTREIDDALLDAQHQAKKAEESEHRAEQEAAQANDLSRQLDEERRKRDEIAAEFARFRDMSEHAPVDDPWGVLWRAVSQIVSNWVAMARALIPPDSRLLPWFDRAVELASAAVRVAAKCAKAAFEWTKPRVVDFLKWVKAEIERRMRKD